MKIVLYSEAELRDLLAYLLRKNPSLEHVLPEPEHWEFRCIRDAAWLKAAGSPVIFKPETVPLWRFFVGFMSDSGGFEMMNVFVRADENSPDIRIATMLDFCFDRPLRQPSPDFEETLND